MSVADKVKSIMALKGIKSKDLAAMLGLGAEAMRSKFYRDSFSVEDLIKICDALGVQIALVIDDKNQLYLNRGDISK